jgi:hypothetical protein
VWAEPTGKLTCMPFSVGKRNSPAISSPTPTRLVPYCGSTAGWQQCRAAQQLQSVHREGSQAQDSPQQAQRAVPHITWVEQLSNLPASLLCAAVSRTARSALPGQHRQLTLNAFITSSTGNSVRSSAGLSWSSARQYSLACTTPPSAASAAGPAVPNEKMGAGRVGRRVGGQAGGQASWARRHAQLAWRQAGSKT